jgi:hypothetical protein
MKMTYEKIPSKYFISIVAIFLWLACSVGNAFASDLFLLSFGNGKKEVRLYSNFFCSHCRDIEPKVEYLLTSLVKRKVITLTFIDLAPNSSAFVYVKSFLYILNEKKELSHTLKARSTLFEASKAQITDPEKLEAYMRSKGFSYKVFDPKPVFATLQRFIQEDNIDSTPTCVIINGKNKETFMGTENIVAALEQLK